MAVTLKVEHLDAWYGPAQALYDIELELPRGSALGVVGRNGAGKSTLLRSIARVHSKIAGTIEIEGASVSEASPFRVARAGVGFVREGAPVFTQLKVRDNLRLGQGLARSRKTEAVPLEELYETFPLLKELRERRAGLLSGGQRQMLALATAMASLPRLLLLDEPSAGLAPEAARSVFEAIGRLCSDGLTVLIAEQNQDWLAGIAGRSVVLERGRIVGEASAVEPRTPGNAVHRKEI